MTAVEHIIRRHRERDPLTTEIYYSETSEELRLLEISEDVTTVGAVIPFRFRPHDGYLLPISIAVISPEELELLKQGDIDMPEGWGRLEEMEHCQNEDRPEPKVRSAPEAGKLVVAPTRPSSIAEADEREAYRRYPHSRMERMAFTVGCDYARGASKSEAPQR